MKTAYSFTVEQMTAIYELLFAEPIKKDVLMEKLMAGKVQQVRPNVRGAWYERHVQIPVKHAALEYVGSKSELTAAKEANELKGFDCYRTRLKCQCKQEFNRRDGVIVIDPSGPVKAYVVRCKSCVKSVNQSINPSKF